MSPPCLAAPSRTSPLQAGHERLECLCLHAIYWEGARRLPTTDAVQV